MLGHDFSGGNLAQFNWLHLSDLHLGLRGSRLLRPEYREAFERDLRKLHERSGPWDLVLISGDLTLTGSLREFELVNSFLDSLWEFFGALGSQPCLLAVPGDMDFQWGMVPQLHSLSASEVWKHLWDTGLSTHEQLAQSLAPFTQWFSDWLTTHPAPAAFKEGLLPGDFAATVVKGNSKIGIIGLNSVLRDDPGIREFHVEQISTATGEDIQRWARQHDLLLLLTYFPPSQLNPTALDRIHEALVPPGHPFLHLCGGRSSSGYRGNMASTLLRGGRGISIQTPSLFSEIRGPPEWGYTVGQFSLSGESRMLRLFPRAASSSNGVVTLAPHKHLGPEETLNLPLQALLWKAPAQQAGNLGDATPKLPLGTVQPPLPPGVKLQVTLSTGEQRISGLAWSPSGDALGVGLADGHVTLWSPGEQSPRWEGAAHVSGLESLCFSPDGQTLASRSKFNLRLWRRDGSKFQTNPPIQGEGSVLAWSSSGLLATDKGEGYLGLWDTQAWKPVSALPPPSALPRCIVWPGHPMGRSWPAAAKATAASPSGR